MSVDASAVSRIEKGTRSVRLVEAVVIAKALGVSLGHLTLAPPKDPPTQLRSYRLEANLSLRKLANELWPTLLNIWQVLEHIENYQEVLQDIEGEPSDILEYLAGATQRLDQWPVSWEEVVAFRDDQIPGVEAFMAKFVRLYLGREAQGNEAERLVEADYTDGFNQNPV